MNSVALAHPFLMQPLTERKDHAIASLGLSNHLAEEMAVSFWPQQPQDRGIKIVIGAQRGRNVERVGLVKHSVLCAYGRSSGEAINPLSLIRGSFREDFAVALAWQGWMAVGGKPNASGSVRGRMRRSKGMLCQGHFCYLRPRPLSTTWVVPARRGIKQLPCSQVANRYGCTAPDKWPPGLPWEAHVSKHTEISSLHDGVDGQGVRLSPGWPMSVTIFSADGFYLPGFCLISNPWRLRRAGNLRCKQKSRYAVGADTQHCVFETAMPPITWTRSLTARVERPAHTPPE